MGRFSLFFLLWFALEIYLFVLLGQTIGFLLTIFLLFFISFAGMSVAKSMMTSDLRKMQRFTEVIMKSMEGAPVDLNEDGEKILTMEPHERENYMMSLKKRIMFSQIMMLMYLIPGFATDAVAIVLMLVNIKGSLFQKDLFSSPVFDKANIFKSRNQEYEDFIKKYGKSTRDLEKEAQERARAEQGNIPRENPDAGKATISEMKARFQAEKEIKDAKFEEIVEDDSPNK